VACLLLRTPRPSRGGAITLGGSDNATCSGLLNRTRPVSVYRQESHFSVKERK
jgi:hypothetical protein